MTLTCSSMLALDEFFLHEVKWTYPQGRLLLRVTLPADVDGMRLFNEAIRQNLAFVHDNLTLRKAMLVRTSG